MRTISVHTISGSVVRCAVCATHARPLYVPWPQHAIGCPIRTAELERRQLDLRPLPAITRAA